MIRALTKKQVFAIAIISVIFFYPSIVSAKNIHLEYNWAEASINPFLPNETSQKIYTSCFACHKSLGVTGATHAIERKKCEDCHVPGQSGPFVFYEPGYLYLNLNYSRDIKMVYYHIANLSTSRTIYKYEKPIFVETLNKSKSTCFSYNPETDAGVCHGIPSGNPVDGYFAFNSSRFLFNEEQNPDSAAYHYAVEAANLPDTKNCLYCHSQKDERIRKAFAEPKQINAEHFNAEKNEDCYKCHVDKEASFTSFHNLGKKPEIIYVEAPPTTPPPPTPLPELMKAQDKNPPEIKIYSPENKTYNINQIALEYSAKDDLELSSCWYSINRGSNISLGKCENKTLNLDDGNYIIALYANDSAGNLAKVAVHFTIKTKEEIPETKPPATEIPKLGKKETAKAGINKIIAGIVILILIIAAILLFILKVRREG